MSYVSYETARRIGPKILTPWLDRIQTSAIGSRRARGIFWTGTGAIISRALGLLGSIVIARILGREIFGVVGMFQSTINMFATFAVFGMNLTANKHVAEYRKSDPDRAGRIIGMTGMMSWVCGIGAVLPH